MAHVLVQFVGGHRALLGYVLLDRAPESRMADLVRAVGDRRQESSRQLVLALRPGLEQREAALDGELYPLVVAELEVQVSYLLVAPQYRPKRAFPL